MRRAPEIKVCGIGDAAFARRAETLGVDYLGFIFAAGSPRRISPERAASIVAELSGRAKIAGVFTDAPIDAILDAARRVPLDVVQLHGSGYGADDVARLKSAGLEVWRLNGLCGADALLLDGASADGRSGGTGQRADWRRASELAAAGVRVVLAGGISAENVREAAATGCAVVDVNSSLETSPGVKSAALLNAFFAAAAPLPQGGASGCP